MVVPACIRSPAEGRVLARCIEALRRADPPPHDLVVVDDGSPHPVDLPGVRVVRQPNRGPAAARNRGAAEVEGDVLVFVDADIEVPRDAFATLATALMSPSVGAAWGTVTAAHPHPGLVSRYKNLSHLHFTTCLDTETRHLTTMTAAVRREAFEGVGGFDETFHRVSVEDVELGRDLHDAGWRVVLERRVVCVHWHRFTLAGALVNDFCKLRALVAATLRRRAQGRPSTTAFDRAASRQRWYAASAPFGAVAVGALLCGRPAWAVMAAAAMVAMEWKLWRFLATHEGTGFALACIPIMALERVNALLAGGVALLERPHRAAPRRPPGSGTRSEASTGPPDHRP